MNNHNDIVGNSPNSRVKRTSFLPRIIKWMKQNLILWILPISLLLFIGLIRLFFYPELVLVLIKHKWDVLLIYIAIMVYISWMHGKWFIKHKQNLRRTWYTFFIIGIALLFRENGFIDSSWTRVGLLTSMFVFVDIALFLTPMIKKIGGAELDKIEEVQDTSEELRKAIEVTNIKMEYFTGIMEGFERKEFPSLEYSKADAYWQGLEKFLNERYGNSNFLSIYVYPVRTTDDLVHLVGVEHGIQLNEEQLEQLAAQEVLYLFDAEVTLLPFYKILPTVIGVKTKREIVQEIDVSNVISLAVVHSWMIYEYKIDWILDDYRHSYLQNPEVSVES